MTDTVTHPKTQFSSVFELPDKSWKIVKKYWKLFAFVSIFSILDALASIFGNGSDQAASDFFNKFEENGLSSGEIGNLIGVALAIGIVLLLLTMFFYAMVTSLELKSSKGEKVDIDTLIEAGKKYWLRITGLSIVSGFLIILGLIAFIIPGIIIFGRIIFAAYIMVDRDLGVIDSLKASNEMVKGRAGAVWSAIGLFILISIASGFLSIIPILGPILGLVLAVGYSLIIVLRYFEIKAVARPATAKS